MAVIEDGMYQPSMKARRAELDTDKQKLNVFLEESAKPSALKTEATEAVRRLVSAIRMIPDVDAPNEHRIELAADLAGILSLGDAKTTKPASESRDAVRSNLGMWRGRRAWLWRLRDELGQQGFVPSQL